MDGSFRNRNLRAVPSDMNLALASDSDLSAPNCTRGNRTARLAIDSNRLRKTSPLIRRMHIEQITLPRLPGKVQQMQPAVWRDGSLWLNPTVGYLQQDGLPVFPGREHCRSGHRGHGRVSELRCKVATVHFVGHKYQTWVQ